MIRELNTIREVLLFRVVRFLETCTVHTSYILYHFDGNTTLADIRLFANRTLRNMHHSESGRHPGILDLLSVQGRRVQNIGIL